jgi:hypothetical protein
MIIMIARNASGGGTGIGAAGCTATASWFMTKPVDLKTAEPRSQERGFSIGVGSPLRVLQFLRRSGSQNSAKNFRPAVEIAHGRSTLV